MARGTDITGQRFGRLVAIERVGANARKQALWHFRCDCGGEKVAVASEVKRGSTQSCGCLANEQRRAAAQTQCHAYSRRHWPREYKSWEHMLSRCYDPADAKYAIYGGRGIKVCDAWRESFRAFADDMGRAPAGCTIDRIDVDGDYTPENCRWATRKEQANNMRTNRLVTMDGKTQTVQQWCDELGADSNLVYQRLFRGWDEKRAILEPSHWIRS